MSDASAEAKLARLINRLVEKTLEGSVEWERTVPEDYFQATFPAYTVHIGKEVDTFTERASYVLKIFNEDNELIEEVTDGQLRGEMTDSFARMAALHSGARRKAMGVEEAVDNLLGVLGEGDVPL